MVVIKCYKHVLECEIRSGTRIGDRIYLPRLRLEPMQCDALDATLVRQQFPIKVQNNVMDEVLHNSQVCYGMTINRSQSQTMDAVGLLLVRPVFAHGHLYTAFSRVGRRDQLKVFVAHDKPAFDNDDLTESEDTYTQNIVYNQILTSD